MGEFSLSKLLAYYMRKIYIILIFALVFAAIGYYYETKIKIPMYEAEVSILLVQKQTKVVDTNKYYENITLNKKLVADYSELLKSRRVLSKVKENLELSRSVEGLYKRISVWTLEDTSMIHVTVRDKDSDDAMIIANELATVFKAEIKSLYNLENVQIIDEAVERKNPYNIYVVRDTLLAGVIGIVLACGILFIYVFIKSKGDFNTFFDERLKKDKSKKGLIKKIK